jgi:ABC-type Fe3+-hydroxamate transport system substrate-binding protein
VLEVDDDLGRPIRLAQPAARIVSLVPSLTELLFSLGCGPTVIGVTRYCVEPADAVAAIPKVGGTKNPDLAAICGLLPDVVIANAEENRKADFDALESAGITLFVTFPDQLNALPSLMRRLGRLTGRSPAAERLAIDLEAALAEATLADEAPRRRVFCPIWKNPWMTFNRHTYSDDMLWCAGGANVCRDLPERYPSVDLATIAPLAPEVILLPDEPYVFGTKDLPSLVPLAHTPAQRNGRIHFIDGKLLSWYGPRTAPGLRSLKKLLDSCT